MSRYSKGAKFENKVKDFLESRYYFCVRSAGSKSIVDIVAFGKRNYKNEILLIQCKYGNSTISKQDKKDLIYLAFKYQCIPVLAYMKKYEKEIHFNQLVNK